MLCLSSTPQINPATSKQLWPLGRSKQVAVSRRAPTPASLPGLFEDRMDTIIYNICEYVIVHINGWIKT